MILASLILAFVMQDVPGVAPPNPQEDLIARIRETLQKIDDALLDTADRDAGVADALGDLRSKHEQVIRDLEELIESARYSNSQQGGGGGSSQNQPPSDGQQGQQDQPQPRESDGQNSPEEGQEQGAPQPQDSGEGQQEDQQQQGETGAEDKPAPDTQPASNNQAGDVPPDPIAPITREDTDGRWGLLPPKLQERLMNLHVDDVPERYRRWLEAYIKAMHRLENDG